MAARTRLLERVAALVAGEAEPAGARAQGLRADPGDRSAQPRAALALRAALPARRRSGRGCWRPTRCCWARRRRATATALAERLELLRRGAPDLRAAARLEGAGLPVVRARLRGGAQERGRAHRPRAAGRRGGRVGRAGGALRSAHGGDDRRRGAAVAAAPRAAHRLDAALQARRTRASAAEQILTEVGFDEEADAALEQILTQTKAWPDLAKLLHARADRAPDAAERVQPAVPHRAARGGARGRRGRRGARPGRRSSRPSRPTSARCAALVRVCRGAPGLGGRGRGRCARDLASRPARQAREEREELLLRIGEHSGDAARRSPRRRSRRTARCCRRTRTRRRPWRASSGWRRAGTPDRAAIARLALPFYERTDNAAKLAGANEALLAVADTRGEKVERLEKLRALYGGPLERSGGRLPRRPGAVRDRSRRTRRTATRCSGSPTRAGKTGELAEKLRAVVGRRPRISNLRRDLLVVVAELQEKRLGTRAGRREGLRARSSSRRAAARGRVPGAVAALPRRRSAGRSCARCSTRASWPSWTRASGWSCWRRSPSSTRRRSNDPDHALAVYEKMLELDPADLRAHRALDRHYAARERWRDLEDAAGDAGRLRLGGRGAGAGVPARRAARQPPRRRRRRARPAGRDRQGRAQPRGCAPPAREAAGDARAAPARRADPRAASTRRAAPGRAWRRSSRSSARRCEGHDGGGAAGAHRRPAGEQAAGARRRRSRPGGRCWRPIRATPTRCREIERLATALERFSELVDVYQELAFKRDASDISGPRRPAVARGASCTRGASATGAPPSTPGSWSSTSIADNTDDGRAGGGGAGGAVRRDRRRRRPGEDPAPCRCAGPTAADDAQEDPVPHRRAARRSRWATSTAAVATLRSILEIDPQDARGDRRAGSDLRGGRAAPPAGRDPAQADRPGRRRGGAPGAVAAASRACSRRDVGDVDEAIAACVSILDENPEDDQALETLARLYEQQGRHRERLEILERRLALRRPQATPTRVGAAAADRDAAGRAAGRSGERARALARGARGRPAPGGRARRWRRWSASWRRATDARPAAGGGAGAGADLRAGRAATPSWPAVVRVYVEAQTDARARLEQLMRLAALEETRLGDTEAALAHDGAGHPRRPGRARAARRCSTRTSAWPGPQRRRPRSPRSTATSAPTSSTRRSSCGSIAPSPTRRARAGRRDDGGRLLPPRARSRPRGRRRAGGARARSTAAAATRRRSTRSSSGAPSWPERPGGRARAARCRSARWPRRRSSASTRRSPPTSGCSRSRPHDRDARAGARSPVHQGRALERSDALPRARLLAARRLPERELVGHPLPAGADRARSARRSRERRSSTCALVLRGDPGSPRRDRDARGDARRRRRAGRGGRAARAGLRRARRLAVADQDRRDPPAAGRGSGRAAGLDQAHRAPLRGAARGLRQRAALVRQGLPGGADRAPEPPSSCCAWPTSSIAGRTSASLLAGYLDGELGEEPAVLDIVRRTAEIFDLRLGERAEAQKYYRRLFDARPDDRDDRAAVRSGARALGSLGGAARARRRAGGAGAVDPAARVALLRRSAKLDEERLDDADRAIGTLREALEVDPTDRRGRPPSWSGCCRRGRPWHDLADHLALQPGRACRDARRRATRSRCAWPRSWRRGSATPTGAVDRYAEILPTARPRHRDGRSRALEGLADDADQRYRVAVILEPVYRRGGRPRQAGRRARRAARDRSTTATERVRDPAARWPRSTSASAASTWRSTAAAAPGSTDVESTRDAAARWRRSASARKLHAPLVATLQKGAVEAIDPDLQAQLWACLGPAARGARSADAAEAIEAWRAALAARPDDRDAFLALERLLAGAGALGRAGRGAGDATSRSPLDADERKVIAKRIAVLYEDALKEREQAVRAWEDGAGDRRRTTSRRWTSLAQLHLAGGVVPRARPRSTRARSRSPSAPSERRHAAPAERARIYDEKLERAGPGRRASCARCWTRAPGDGEALDDARSASSPREGRHADLRRGARRARRRRAEDAGRARRAGVPRGAPHRDRARRRRGRRSRATSAILAATPAARRGARGAVRRSRAATTTACRRSRRSEPVLRAARDWDGVIELLELRLAVEDAVAARLALLAEIARIEETERRDVDKRVRGLGARARPRRRRVDEPREALERLAAATGDWARPGRRLRRAHGRDVRRRRCSASLALRLADAARERAGRPRTRRRLPAQGAERCPGDEAAGAGVAGARAAQARASTPSWPRSWRARPRSPAIRARRPTSWRRWASCAWRALERRRRRAGRVPRRGRARRRTHAGARAALHRRCSIGRRRARGRSTSSSRSPRRAATTSELVALYERRLELRDDRAERAHWLRKIAEVAADQLGEPERALEALGRALKEEPMPGAALDDLERDRRRGQAVRPRAPRQIEAALGGAEPDAARELALRAARLYERRRATARPPSGCTCASSSSDAENVDALSALEGLYRGARATPAAAGGDARAARGGASSIRRPAATRLLEAARLHEGRGRHRRRRWRRCRQLRAADEGDADALERAGAPARGAGPGRPSSTAVLAERARLDRGSAGQRAALWSRVGELRLGAAQRSRRRGRGLPRGARGRARRSGWRCRRWRRSRSAARTGRRCRRCCCGASARRRGADQVAVLLKLARNAEQKLSDVDQAVGFLRQIARRRSGATAFGVPRARADAARRRALVRPGRRAGQARRRRGRRPGASRPSWRCGSPSPTSGRRSSTRPRAPPRRWRRCWRSRPTNVGGAAVAGAPARGAPSAGTRRARRWSARRPRRRRRRRRSPRSSSATRRSCARKEARRRPRSRRALLRALDARPDPPPDAGGAGEDGARRPRTTSGWCSILELAAGDGDRRRRAQGALLREIAALYAGRWARRRRRCRTSSGWWRSTRRRSRGARAAGRGADRRRAAPTRPRADGGAHRELTKARRGKDAARWQHAAGHDRRGARRHRGGGRAASTPPTSWTPATRPRWRRWAGSPTGRSDFEARAQVLPLAAAAELRRGDGRRLEGRGLPDARPHARPGQRDPQGAQHVRARPGDRSEEHRPEGRAGRPPVSAPLGPLALLGAALLGALGGARQRADRRPPPARAAPRSPRRIAQRAERLGRLCAETGGAGRPPA